MSNNGKDRIKYDKEKVDEMVLALFYLTTFEEELGKRTWKAMDWGVLSRLHEKGYISNPITKARSVALSKEAAQQSERLFRKYFCCDQEDLYDRKELTANNKVA